VSMNTFAVAFPLVVMIFVACAAIFQLVHLLLARAARRRHLRAMEDRGVISLAGRRDPKLPGPGRRTHI
jgi:hypothetical protein